MSVFFLKLLLLLNTGPAQPAQPADLEQHLEPTTVHGPETEAKAPAGPVFQDNVIYSLDDLDIDVEGVFDHLPEKDRWIWSQAEITLNVGDFNQAEKHLNQFLAYTEDEAAQRTAFLIFIQKYHEAGRRMKLVFFLENFASRFDQDPYLPMVYLYLGQLYSELGSMESARKNFYNVLHLALRFSYTQSINYQRISREAKWGIATTYFRSGAYEEAAKFYERQTRLDLSPEIHARTLARIAECHFLLENFPLVISTLSNLEARAARLLPPHVHYYKAQSYWKLGKRQESLEEVIALLERVSDTKNSSREDWLYWKERTGNHMAGAFLKEGDFFNALKIFQTMAPLDDSGGWQIPIVYKIAVCFENLQMSAKALQAYRYIVQFPEAKLAEEDADTASIEVIREAAQWKIRHLENGEELNRKILSLELDPFTQHPHSSS